MAKRFIPVAAPVLEGNEKVYVLDCLESSWISSCGKYVDQFERAFAEICHAKHASACCNGTVALHLALMALGVQPGDEVLVPTLTFVATANAVRYCGATPVFVDSESETWNMDPQQIEDRITPRTKGIIAVHLYGHPADMDPILSIARQHGLFVVEDAAEAHGAWYKGQRVGCLGDVGTFSFYGNKIVTCGEGGMVLTNDDSLDRKIRLLKGQGMDPKRRYWFPVVGYNYRMTNIAAAIGLGQIEKLDWHLQRRREVATWYREQLATAPGVMCQGEKEWARSAYWMFTVLLNDDIRLGRDQVIEFLLSRGIETRPVFYPIHNLPPYFDSKEGDTFHIAERVASRGISLPTHAGLTQDDVRFVSETLLESMS